MISKSSLIFRMTCFVAAVRVECTVTFSRSNLTVAFKKGIMKTPFHLSALRVFAWRERFG